MFRSTRLLGIVDRLEIDTINADVQAILWYPEKDLWAKLKGEEESDLKNSYEGEFIKIAKSRGLGAEAQRVAESILSRGSGTARSRVALEEGANGATGKSLAQDSESSGTRLNAGPLPEPGRTDFSRGTCRS